jgi:hypothetical protein
LELEIGESNMMIRTILTGAVCGLLMAAGGVSSESPGIVSSQNTLSATYEESVGSSSSSHENVQSAPPNPGYLRANHSGKCLSVLYASTANLAKIVQATCVGGSHQRWYFDWTGGVSYQLRNVKSNKCVHVSGAGTSNGTSIIQYTCQSVDHQRMYMDINTPTRSRLMPAHTRGAWSSKCLDVVEGSVAQNARVILYTCNGRSNQHWNYS